MENNEGKKCINKIKLQVKFSPLIRSMTWIIKTLLIQIMLCEINLFKKWMPYFANFMMFMND